MLSFARPLMKKIFHASAVNEVPVMAKLLIAGLVLIVQALAPPAATPAVHVIAPDRAIGAGDGPEPLVEPHLAIDPHDSSHIVVAAIAAAPDRAGPWYCAAFTSFDAGARWQRTNLPVNRCIDPWVVFAPDGQVLVTLIEIRSDGDADQRFELLQFASRDGGRTWSAPAALGRGYEHPILTAGQGSDGAIYRLVRRTDVTGQQSAHRLHLSRAASSPWHAAESRELSPSSAALNVTGVARLGTGEIIAGYWETEQRPGGNGAERMLPRARTYLLKLPAFSGSTPEPAAITEVCASGIEGAFPGYPSLVHARTGALRDHLFQVCIAPGFDGVTLVHSPDGGRSWRPAVAVHEKAGAAADDSRTPMIAVNDQGALAVAWYEGETDPARGRCQDLWLTASTDAGATFAPAIRINTAPSCPRTPANGRVSESWAMGGDYGSLAAGPDGSFVIAWADSRAERFGLRSARFSVAAGRRGDLSGAQSPERRARTVLDRAQTVMGGAAAIASNGGITVEASGVLNKGAEYQGRTPASLDPGTLREVLTVESISGRVAYEYREDRYDGTSESVREIYPGGDDRLIVLPDAGQVITLRSPDHEAGRRKLARRIPQLLIDELTRAPAGLRWIGESPEEDRIAGALTGGEVATLAFDKKNGVLTRAEFALDVQGFGDTSVVWRFEDYAPVSGIGQFPRRYGVSIADRPFTEMRVSRIERAAAGSFSAPAGYKPVGPIDSPAEANASARAAVQEIVPGVHRVTRLRTGFHPMFVEFADFIVAIDAPAGYRLLNELPPGDVAPGPSSAWLSERYIELIKQAVPGKPIRYVVLTHFHNDHLGGVRAFVAEGATVIAPPDTAAHVRRLVAAPHTLAPDRLAAQPRPLALEVVKGRHSISDGTRRLDLLDVGDNPHGAEMLVAHLPAERLMFVSDLVEPVAVERYPLASHAPLDRFFVRWLDAAGLTPGRVYTMHGAGLATQAHFDKLRVARPAAAPRDHRLRQMQEVLAALDTSRTMTLADAERMLTLLEAAEAEGLNIADRRTAMTALYQELWRLRGFDSEAEQAAMAAAARGAAGMFNFGAQFSLERHAPPPGTPDGALAVVKRGRGPVPMVLISDLGIPAEELYGGFMSRNENRYTMYAVTLPGFGDARVPPQPALMDFSRRPWLDAAERQLMDLLARDNLREVVVVGTSVGGYFSAALAARHPERIRAAVVVNGLVHFPLRALADPNRPADSAERLVRARTAPPIELAPAFWAPESREAFAALIDNPPANTGWRDVMAFGSRDGTLTRRWTLDYNARASAWRQARYTAELVGTDLTPDLLGLTRPLLVINSLHDHLSPGVGVPVAAQWTEIKLRRPDVPVTIATVGDVRAYASIDAPEYFDAALTAFLAGNVVASRPDRAPAALASPFASTSVYAGASEVRIEYFRPGVKGRDVWGKLVPYDTLWRTGANEAPMITFSHDVTVEGRPLAAGAYTLLTIPGERQWTLVFNRLPYQFGTFSYDQTFDALRVTVVPQAAPMREWFAIDAEPADGTGATITLHWERVAVPFRIVLAER
jgi:pimeloyl-ACP methyl ester carboxylesterase/glyoxylase-like metal-dependent hydrolase (beta-lactamase superfamily II)